MILSKPERLPTERGHSTAFLWPYPYSQTYYAFRYDTNSLLITVREGTITNLAYVASLALAKALMIISKDEKMHVVREAGAEAGLKS
jgi:hypothetical protein